jgi:hypothetical protein
MTLEPSILFLSIINVATLAFGYGVLWTQVRGLKDLVHELRALINGSIVSKLGDHERRLIVIEQQHARCDV